MKKLLVAFCLITAAQSSLSLATAVEPTNNESPKNFDECAEKFLAEFFRQKIAFSIIQNADNELTKGIANSHYKVHESARPILQEYGLLNDDNTLKEGVIESFKNLAEAWNNNPEANELFMKKYNIIK